MIFFFPTVVTAREPQPSAHWYPPASRTRPAAAGAARGPLAPAADSNTVPLAVWLGRDLNLNLRLRPQGPGPALFLLSPGPLPSVQGKPLIRHRGTGTVSVLVRVTVPPRFPHSGWPALSLHSPQDSLRYSLKPGSQGPYSLKGSLKGSFKSILLIKPDSQGPYSLKGSLKGSFTSNLLYQALRNPLKHFESL
jgi:hypothetical protein